MEPQHQPVAANCSIDFSSLFGNDIGSATADVIRSRVRRSSSVFFSSLVQFVFLVFILVPGKVESRNFSHRTNSVRIT